MSEAEQISQDVQGEEVCTNDQRLVKASNIISSASRWSAAASLVPVPYVDLAALAAVQAKLVFDMCELYEQPTTKEAVNGTVSVLLGTLVPAGASKVAAVSLVKFIPVYGTVIGVVSMAAFGAAATYAIGRIFVRHFESGGTLQNFSVEKIKEDLKKEFKSAAAKL